LLLVPSCHSRSKQASRACSTEIYSQGKPNQTPRTGLCGSFDQAVAVLPRTYLTGVQAPEQRQEQQHSYSSH
jgi:hypothetical protein